MDFYIDGGGSGGGGGVYIPPAISDPGSVGLGGGGSGGGSSPNYGNFRQDDINAAINSYDSSLQNKYNSLLSSDLPASSKFAIDLLYQQAKGQTSFNTSVGAYNPYGQTFNSLSDRNIALELGKPWVAPSSMDTAYTPSPNLLLPDSEASLLSEYGLRPPGYTPDKYEGTTYTQSEFNQPYSKSAYGTWFESQKKQYSQANNEFSSYRQQQDSNYANSLPVGVPKVFAPNGAPEVSGSEALADELYKLYGWDGRYDVSNKPSLSEYNPLSSDWKGTADISGLAKMLAGLFVPHAKSPAAAKLFDSPTYGLLSTKSSDTAKASDPLGATNLPWQSKNLIKPASYFDESSQGIAPPKGLMGQDMITQNNVLPALQMALMNNQGMPEGNEALDAATKPLSDAKDKGNATDKIQEARNKWKSDSLNKFGNWQSLA